MINKKRFSILHIFLLLYQSLFTIEVDSLKLMRVEVPSYKLQGDEATLECHYQLESESLYAVKWYKDNEEFFRYVPKSNPPVYSYKIEGVKVEHEKSDSRRVMLKRLTLKSSGTYRCEVSAEAPSFASAQMEGRMEVVFLPRSGPHITGEKLEYQIGDHIDLNCTSGKSYPPSVLRWFINDRAVHDEDLVPYPTNVYAHGLVSTVLGLRLTIRNLHFENGSMRVRCIATVSPLLWQGDRESVLQKIDNREALLLVKNRSSVFESRSYLIVTMIAALMTPAVKISY